ncbi:pyrroline-5-carboxylate reductase [gamma proteobacterium HTCC5015]|nr:pyrroline-5-carboxylate reductase [gamma proteobacterium HTCC5015]
MTSTLCFIGGGNMARSLIGGLVANGYPGEQIRVAEPNQENRTRLENEYGIQGFSDNQAAVDQCDAIVLAVKPQILREVLSPLSDTIQQQRPLLISIAAGVPIDAISRWAGGERTAIVRCMPNTPSLLQAGATALFANPDVSQAQQQIANTVLEAAGFTLWVNSEQKLDAVTAVSGSGPAYFFAFIEAMIEAGEKLGLSHEQASQLTLQTALGAARMVNESGDSPTTLRQNVTSKGGTTAAALAAFEAHGLKDTVAKAMEAACQRAAELGDSLNNDTSGE